jgi:hypothetical protein
MSSAFAPLKADLAKFDQMIALVEKPADGRHAIGRSRSSGSICLPRRGSPVNEFVLELTR